jgi:alpha-tubulin suppressor-like RCC1 family protein
MTPRARSTAVAALVAAAFAMAGCGATVYDAVGVPKLVCATAELPLACGNTCLPANKESDAQCGSLCLDCSNGGANALSQDPAASNFCQTGTSTDFAQHTCDFSCDPSAGLQKNAGTNACECSNAAQVRCVGTNGCVAQSDTLCGDGCSNCTDAAQFPAKAHAAWQCDQPNRKCDFFCAAGFKRNANNDGCVCQDPLQVACGAGGTCQAATPTACGASCVNCTVTANFPVNPAFASGVLCAGDGKGAAANTPCDLGCPTATPNKFFNSATGQWDCSAAPVCDPATQHLCSSDNTCHANNDPAACGVPDPAGNAIACTDCNPLPRPAGSTATCAAGACSFDCPAGTFRNGPFACVRAQTTDGSVATGGSHTCAITAADVPGAVPVSLFCWGANASGQLGVGNRTEAHKPQLVALTLGAGIAPVAVAAGAAHTCLQTTDGGIMCWGANATGQLGADPATVADALSPRPPLTGLHAVTDRPAIAAGAGHTCAIVNNAQGNGSVVCWGANDKGQLGNGGTPATFSVAPVPVKTATGNLTGVTQLSTSGDTTCAISSSAGLVCWGANDRGQAGQPSATTKIVVATAIPITPSRTVGAPSRVAAGGSHSCAATLLAAPAATVCWGDDQLQQLGDSGRKAPSSSTPVEATVLANKADLMAAGKQHTCNILSAAGANTVNVVITCAGADNKMQSGAAPPVASINKVDLALPGANGLGVTLLTSGGDHTCVVTAAGALLCFGSNANGQLGDGTISDSAVAISPAAQ